MHDCLVEREDYKLVRFHVFFFFFSFFYLSFNVADSFRPDHWPKTYTKKKKKQKKQTNKKMIQKNCKWYTWNMKPLLFVYGKYLLFLEVFDFLIKCRIFEKHFNEQQNNSKETGKISSSLLALTIIFFLFLLFFHFNLFRFFFTWSKDMELLHSLQLLLLSLSLPRLMET